MEVDAVIVRLNVVNGEGVKMYRPITITVVNNNPGTYKGDTNYRFAWKNDEVYYWRCGHLEARIVSVVKGRGLEWCDSVGGYRFQWFAMANILCRKGPAIGPIRELVVHDLSRAKARAKLWEAVHLSLARTLAVNEEPPGGTPEGSARERVEGRVDIGPLV